MVEKLSHNYRLTSTQRKLQYMKANCSSRIFDQQSICACGEVSCLPLLLTFAVHCRNSQRISNSHNLQIPKNWQRKKERKTKTHSQHFTPLCVVCHTLSNGPQRREKEVKILGWHWQVVWSTPARVKHAGRKRHSNWTGTGKGLQRGEAEGETVRIGAGDTETCCKMQSEGTALLPGLALKWVQHWLCSSLSRCLTACHRLALRQTSNLK